jgi:dTDP-4-dehydrorhamnose 3,5-epimerase
MFMRATRLELDGLILVELDIRGDERGFFAERFKHSAFRELGLPSDFRQDNHSRSALGVLRGLHYQADPPQGKLVGVIRGRIWDVVVDIRPHSPTFGRSHHLELSDMNGRMLWVPPGFAHGFCVIGDEPADVYYKVDEDYNPATEGGIIWSDPQLAIPWPVSAPITSTRDGALPGFAEYRARPVTWRP